jgi:5-methylcytosine-specific restriction endonuclease McrA
MNDIENDFQALIAKCCECGVDPLSFVIEKRAELEERKMILSTPSLPWYRDNSHSCADRVAKSLQRLLTEEEVHGADGLLSKVKRRLNPLKRETVTEATVKKILLTESKGRCTICGKQLSIDTIVIDHILPLAEGGSNHTLNLRATCALCNAGKSDYYENTAVAAARPWWEPRESILKGAALLTATKRYCALIRDDSSCRKCNRKADTVCLEVILRVREHDGGMAIYDNLISICEQCKRGIV